jgi:hypothetical protein
MGRYRESYPQYFALLSDDLAETIELVITNNVLWGWNRSPARKTSAISASLLPSGSPPRNNSIVR